MEEKSFVRILFLALIIILPVCSPLKWTEHPDLLRCPVEYGTCNTCTKIREKLVALTRNVCGNEYGEYTEKKCLDIFNGVKSGFCGGEGCDWCTCHKDGLEVIAVDCPKYDYETCVNEHGMTWRCGGSECTCTNFGIGYNHAPEIN